MARRFPEPVLQEGEASSYLSGRGEDEARPCGWRRIAVAAELREWDDPEAQDWSRALGAAARAHADASLPFVASAHDEGSHWLGTFAVYLLTGRGLPPALAR